MTRSQGAIGCVPLLLEVFNNHGFNGRNGIYET